MNMKGLRVIDLSNNNKINSGENYIVEAKPLAKLYTRSISEIKIGNFVVILRIKPNKFIVMPC